MLKIAWHKSYCLNLPENHKFPMKKYNLLPQLLLDEKIVEKENFFKPELIEERYILLAHSETYWNNLKNLTVLDSDFRKIGFPQSEEVVLRERYLCEGTRKSADYAIDYGISFNIAGGTHHAFSYKGEGFCLLNDMAIAAHYLFDSRKSNRIMIIDLDVHQGNGTAEIFNNVDRVYTLSLHGKNNYPLKKEISDLDIELPDAIKDEEYLALLNDALQIAFDRFQPDFIFYQCGVDILESDKFGRLGVSIEGCKKRDEIILNLAKNNNIPIACSMGGGYSPDINVILDAHSNTYKLAKEIFF